MWKNLIPINDRLPDYVQPRHAARMRSVAREVQGRTSLLAWFDVNHDELCFGHEPNGVQRIVFSRRAFRGPGFCAPDYFDHTLGSDVDANDIAYSIMLARVPQEQKDKWKAEQEKAVADENKKARRSRIADATKEGFDRTESKFNRYTMGRHHKGFAQMSS